MTTRPFHVMVIMAALAFGWAGTAGATGGATAAQKCEAAKLKASAHKAKCLLGAEAHSVLTGRPPNTARCVANFEAAFAAAEQRAGGQCPTEGDVNDIEFLIDACRDDVAAALSGFPLAPCGEFPATGQTNSFQARDDGDLEAGATLSYTDTGVGTIIDNNTGLEWEKKTAANVGTPHTWLNAFAYIDSLNTANFAGHNDWRLPNVKELQRGNRREDVFFDEADRVAYLAWLGEYCAKYKVKVLAYCLMTNHAHVVAVPGSDQALERVFRPLCTPDTRSASIVQRDGRDICGRDGFSPRPWTTPTCGRQSDTSRNPLPTRGTKARHPAD